MIYWEMNDMSSSIIRTFRVGVVFLKTSLYTNKNFLGYYNGIFQLHFIFQNHLGASGWQNGNSNNFKQRTSSLIIIIIIF